MSRKVNLTLAGWPRAIVAMLLWAISLSDGRSTNGQEYIFTTVAGGGGFVGADEAGAPGRFNNPNGVAVDGSGNVYVADTFNHVIWKVTPARVVTNLAGQVGGFGSADGTRAEARFYGPIGVTVDSTGNIFVADAGNYTIRKVTPDGLVTTLAGLAGNPGSADGTGRNARFGELNN